VITWSFPSSLWHFVLRTSVHRMTSYLRVETYWFSTILVISALRSISIFRFFLTRKLEERIADGDERLIILRGNARKLNYSEGGGNIHDVEARDTTSGLPSSNAQGATSCLVKGKTDRCAVELTEHILDTALHIEDQIFSESCREVWLCPAWLHVFIPSVKKPSLRELLWDARKALKLEWN
jgi:hypothetical protein